MVTILTNRTKLTLVLKTPARHCTEVRAVGRSENLGVPVLFGRHNLPPLVEIGLTDRPKIGGAMAPPAPPGTTGLLYLVKVQIL